MKDNVLDLDSLPRSVDGNNQKEFEEFKKDLPNFFKKGKEAIDVIMDTPISTLLFASKVQSTGNTPKLAFVEGVNLISRIKGKNGKYRTPRKIASLFLHKSVVEKFDIVKLIVPLVDGGGGNRRRIYKKDYLSNKRKYEQSIKNKFKYLQRVAFKIGYRFKFHDDAVEIVKLT